MLKIRTAVPFAAVCMFLGAGIAAHADTFTFSFDPLAAGTPSQGGGNTSTSSIQGYMQSLLEAGQTVTVTGGVADQNYTGEGHVVGPGTSYRNATSLTLGNTNGATTVTSTSSLDATKDTFIANTNDSSQQVSNEIIMTFSGLTINGIVSFDYEIFPDGSAEQPPDFEFAAGPTGSTSNIFTAYGVTPGTSPISTKISPDSNTESSAQLIGHWSGTITGATELDFIDWPATIGIDNLVITTTNPEPTSIILFGTVAAGVLFLKRRSRRSAASKA